MSQQLTYQTQQALRAEQIADIPLLNLVEPDYLVDVFLEHPPHGFEAMQVQASPGAKTPAFLANFDLLTTVDDAKDIRAVVNRFPFLKRFLQFPTIFVGTTVTEYANYPDQNCYRKVIASLLHEMRKQNAQIVIVKDLPQCSPLLSKRENDQAEQLLTQCREAGFFPVEGQALAYVPIDFKSIDEYMQRLSKSRRKEFRKKLKDSAHVQIDDLACGSPVFSDESFLEKMYSMYENVFRQSEIQFDVLTKSFFRALLQDRKRGGKVFLYWVDGHLIGYNICFVHNKRLIDKYIGFEYPAAREANLYFLSWFHNLKFALEQGLEFYVAGWTDPAVKKSLGATFTLTHHAVYIRNPLLRAILKPIKHLFESDSDWVESHAKP